MSAFLDVALGIPTVLFSFALLVVAGYWVLVLLGALGIHVLDHDADTGAGVVHGHGHHGHGHHGHGHHGHGHHGHGHHGHDGHGEGGGGLLAAAGLAGPPVTVTLSLLIALAWFLSLAGRVAADGLAGSGHAWVGAPVLVVAVIGAWAGTRTLVRPLRRVFPDVVAPSRADFVGRTCVIRTGRVTGDFGQAEVAAEDGSTAVVQVRTPEAEAGVLGHGATALIFDYDPVAEVFLVMPFDGALSG